MDETEPKTAKVTILQQDDPKHKENSREWSPIVKSRNKYEETEHKTPLEIDAISNREETSMLLKENIEIETGNELLYLRDDVGISLSLSILDSKTQSVTSASTKDVGEVDTAESARMHDTNIRSQESDGINELTTGMVEEIGAELDATVERSRLRNEGEQDLKSSIKDEKDADEGFLLIIIVNFW
jgi:hypothetical protein